MSTVCVELSEAITVGSTTFPGAVISLPSSAGQVYKLDGLVVTVSRDSCVQEVSEANFPATTPVSHLIRMAPAMGPTCTTIDAPCTDFAWLSLPGLVTGKQRGSLDTTTESAIRPSNWAPVGWVIWVESADCAESGTVVSAEISFSLIKMTAAMERELLDSLMTKPCST